MRNNLSVFLEFQFYFEFCLKSVLAGVVHAKQFFIFSPDWKFFPFFSFFCICVSNVIPVDTGRKLNVHKTFSTSSERLMYVQFTLCVYGKLLEQCKKFAQSLQWRQQTDRISLVNMSKFWDNRGWQNILRNCLSRVNLTFFKQFFTPFLCRYC